MKYIILCLLVVLLFSCKEETPLFDKDCNVNYNRYIVTNSGCSDMPLRTVIYFDVDSILNTWLIDQNYCKTSCNGGEMVFTGVNENSFFEYGYIELIQGKERLFIKVSPEWYSKGHISSILDPVKCVIICDRYD